MVLLFCLYLSGCKSENQHSMAIKALQKPGALWENSIGMHFSALPAGEFPMGSQPQVGYAPERPQHKVHISTGLAMATTEVTLDHFKYFLNDLDSIPESWVRLEAERIGIERKNGQWTIKGAGNQFGESGEQPITYVTQLGAIAFCDWLSKKEGLKYRLPSEAEWEYACLAGSTTHFFFGNTIHTDQANYNGTYEEKLGFGLPGIYRKKTSKVGSFEPNAFGLYDMHGNVWEYTQDSWHNSFKSAPTDGTAWVAGGDSTMMVIKGGSWYTDATECRCSARFGMPVDEPNSAWGFRVLLELPHQENH